MLDFDRVHAIDAREGLKQLDAESVDCVVTSPPYWATRDYGVAATSWRDGAAAVLGLEPSAASYVDHLIEVFDGVWRVLKAGGTLWVNLGDCYAGPRTKVRTRQHADGHHPLARGTRGLHLADDSSWAPTNEKSLCLVPERFAVAMTDRGWILRNRIVWHKPNYLGTSARDRFGCSWEYLFFFTKSPTYHFDVDAVRIPHRCPRRATIPTPSRFRHRLGERRRSAEAWPINPRGKNPGDCWAIATTGSRLGHPAVFPEALCERPILAGCPPDGVVLDPFAGSGTTLVVARRLGRRSLGFDVSPAFAEIANKRLAAVRERAA